MAFLFLVVLFLVLRLFLGCEVLRLRVYAVSLQYHCVFILGGVTSTKQARDTKLFCPERGADPEATDTHKFQPVCAVPSKWLAPRPNAHIGIRGGPNLTSFKAAESQNMTAFPAPTLDQPFSIRSLLISLIGESY